MIERVSSIENFAGSLPDFYPALAHYLVQPDGPELIASNSRAFCLSRFHMLETLLHNLPGHQEMSLALALEYLVHLALRGPLSETGFTLDLSPQSLECSQEGQKGVDLLIADSNQLVYLGIDVKLRVGASAYERDGYGWNARLFSPYIYLSLGNFSVSTRDQQQLSVRDWFRSCAVPHIRGSGKIPHLDQFRSYLISRIERSLNGYLERLREPEMYSNDFGIPTTANEQALLTEKLATMQSLFTDLRLN